MPSSETLAAFLSELTAAVSGRVAVPADADWMPVSMSWNPALRQSPAAVLLAADAADVATAVRIAAAHGVAVTPQADGHASTPHLDETLLIRTSALDAVEVDDAAGIARVGAGVRWLRLQEALAGTGLAGLAGSHPDIAVVPFTIGGGLSWFSRRHGRASGGLLRAEVVTADGVLRWIDDASEPELMRALRGGGGDFAIVTAAEIRLVPAPEITGGLIEYPGALAAPVSAVFEGLSASAPRETAWNLDFARVPPLPDIPRELWGQQLVRVEVVHLGPAEELAASLAALEAAGPVIRSTVAPRTPATVAEVAEEPRDPTPALHAAVLVDAIDAELLATLARVAEENPALLVVQLRSLGGALAEESGLPSADVPITAGGLINSLAIAVDDDTAKAARAAFAALRAALAPRTVAALPYTFLDPAETPGLCFGADGLERLRAVKAAVDPDRLIRANHPVHS